MEASRNGSRREPPTRDEIRSWVAQEIASLGIDPQDAGDVKASFGKKRGDYFADCAIGSLIRANQSEDSLRAANVIAEAKVYASLSLRDAIQECTATLKQVAHRQIDSSEELTAQLREVA